MCGDPIQLTVSYRFSTPVLKMVNGVPTVWAQCLCMQSAHLLGTLAAPLLCSSRRPWRMRLNRYHQGQNSRWQIWAVRVNTEQVVRRASEQCDDEFSCPAASSGRILSIEGIACLESCLGHAG